MKIVYLLFCLSFLFIGCRKIEKRFPTGYYKITSNTTVNGEPGNQENSISFNIKMIQNADNLLTIQNYNAPNGYSIINDTIFDDIGFLDVSDKQSVSGMLDVGMPGGEDFIMFSDGVVKSNTITGKIAYEFWAGDIGLYYRLKREGTFTFEKDE